MASVGDVAARIAKVAAAFAFGGPAAGGREVVVQSTDVLSKRDHTFMKVLADVEKQLLAVSTARGWSSDQADVALTAAADIFEADSLTARELVATGLDAGAAANALLARGTKVLATLSTTETRLTRDAVVAAYTALLSDGLLLKGLDRAFQQHVVQEFGAAKEATQELRAAMAALRRRLPLEQAVAGEGASPATLVRARAGVLPFVDRWGLLDELTAWLEDNGRLQVLLIGGRGGSGKTRLAVELCERATRRGWIAGFLKTSNSANDVDAAALESLGSTPQPRLVVVDYAETRVPQLDVLLELLRDGASIAHPVRVLLLVRSVPRDLEDWRDAVRVGASDALDSMLRNVGVQVIEQVDERDRGELFTRTAEKFVALRNAAAPGGESPVVFEPPDLSRDVFDNSLMVVIAAYLAAHHSDGVVPTTRAGLLVELVRHEQHYWSKQWKRTGLGPDDAVLQSQIVALATLTTVTGEDNNTGRTAADAEAEAAKLLTWLPDLAKASAERSRSLARWAHNLYPATRLWWNSLEPDLLAEQLVATQFTNHPDILAAALQRLDRAALGRTLDLLARAAADHPRLARTLTPVLADQLAKLCRVAIEQTRSTREWQILLGPTTVAAALDRVLTVITVDPAAVSSAVGLFPGGANLILGPLALTLTGQVTANSRRLAAANPAAYEPALAAVLNNFSIRLAESGRRDQALTAIQDAVEVYRRLADANPAAYEPALAAVLNNFSIRLAESGRRDEALTAIQDAVEVYRRLAAANPAAYEPALAMSLNNLSAALADPGRRDEALTAIQDAVTIRQRLAAANPAAYEPDLATSLNNISADLADAGRRDKTLTAIQDAVTIRQRPANPGAYEPDLARSLNNLSAALADAGRRDEALTAIQDAVEVYRRLADANPAAYEPDLAMSLNTLSVRLAGPGRRDEALTAIQDAVEVYRRLADANPAAYEPDLAMSLNNLSAALADAGRRDEALTAIQDAVTIRERLADANPAAYEPDLAASLNNLSVRFADAGRRDEALTAIQDAVTIRQRLADANPAAYEPDLAASLNNLSVRFADAGRRDEALTAIQDAVTIRQRLADANPAAYEPDLAMSLNNLSVRFADAGRRDEALTVSQDAVEVYRRLVAAKPAAYEPDLAAALNNLSSHLADVGRRDEALTAIQDAVEVYRRLADANPAAYEPDLARSLNNLSSHLADVGRRDEALTAIQDAVTIRRRLADANPAAYEPDLARSLNNLSNHLADAGRRDEAELVRREAVELENR